MLGTSRGQPNWQTRLHSHAVTEWREGMAQVKTIDFPEPNSGVGPSASPQTPHSKRHTWLWVVVAVGIVAGIWYYRSARATSQAQDTNTTAASGKGRSAGAGSFVVPVVV